VASVESARAALDGGADRLEVNRDLARNGLTPSDDLFRAVRAVASVPLVAMVRPHDRGYAYDPPTLERMEASIRRLRALGADGFAVGALTREGRVDDAVIGRLLDAIGDAETVFHRAFDEVASQDEALDALIGLGMTRVLTSGGRPTAVEGASQLAGLVARAGGRIEILPGAGVDVGNCVEILETTGCVQLHGTFRGPGRPSGETSGEVVRRVRRAVDAFSMGRSEEPPPGSGAGILADGPGRMPGRVAPTERTEDG